MPVDQSKLNAVLAQLVEPALERGAKKGAEILRVNVSAGPRSGKQYKRLPRRSSKKGEFTQEQFGDLKRSVGSVKITPTKFLMGYLNTPVHALWLEYKQESKGGRPNLWLTFRSGRTRQAILKEARGESSQPVIAASFAFDRIRR